MYYKGGSLYPGRISNEIELFLASTREEISPRTAAVEVATLSDLDLRGHRSLKGMTLICH